MRKQTILILLILTNIWNNIHSYNLKQIADKEYMTNSSITSLCQDDYGMLWIGTCDGMNVYNGQKIEEFKIANAIDYLTGNLIDRIVYTGNDIYWVQTYHGLNRLDRKTNGIIHYSEFQKLFLMDKDKYGNLFIIQESNSIYYCPKNETKFKKISITGVLISDILNFFIDERNLIWITMAGYNRCFEIIHEPSGEITLESRQPELIYRSSLLYCFNDDEHLLYIDKEYNFFSYNLKSKVNTLISNLRKEIQTHGKISSIIRYHDKFFIGFLMDGLLILEKRDDSQEYDIQQIPINSGVFCMIKDHFQDAIWIGTDGQGVYLYSNPLYSIKSVVLSNLYRKAVTPVRALHIDDERTLWIGTKGNGIIKAYNYDAKKEIFDCKTEMLTISNSDIGSNAVYCFSKSKHNLLWIGNEEGLCYYSYKDKRIRRLPVIINGKHLKYIHDIYETKNSELWIASVGMGIVKAQLTGSPDTPRLEDMRIYTINEGQIGSNYFFTIYHEDENPPLFGNKGYGVFRYNEKTDVLEPVATHKYDNMTLNNILAINKDSCGSYLLGTSYGLIKLSPDSSYHLFNTKDGFPNSTIHEILKTSPYIFWLSTNMGMINFDTRSNVFRTYGVGDGLRVVEFCDGAAFRDPQTGVLYFGGINGFVTITADGQTEHPYMPPIYFDKLSIFGKQYSLGEYITLENGEKKLNLDYNQNFFSVSFICVDFLNGNNYTFSYKLKGLSEQWINNGTESSIAFTNMAPGEYTLQVKYYNSVFDSESKIYSLTICIANPWYTSWWAKIIYSICVLTIIGLFVHSATMRMRRKKQEMLNEIERRHQKNVFESKLSFFTNIAHEFCTPLTLICGPCERILSTKGLNKFVSDYVQMIQVNAERLKYLINELIEFRRIETGHRELIIETLDVSLLMKSLTRSFVEIAKSRNIRFMSKISEDMSWNTDKGFLNTIVINLISNAFKYTPSGKCIKVSLETKEGFLKICVANEGSYIKDSDFQRLFNRYTILDSFENQDKKNFSRNGLGLAISYNMAQLLDGELKAENSPGGWVVFTLTLPALSPDNQKEKRITSEYIPEKIYMQPMIKLPDYEFDKMRPTILVIDDEIEILWLIGEIFSNDFNVVTLQDAGKTEDVLNEMSPNVIICDIKMPDTNGIELVKRIKSQKGTSHIPIIIISGHYEMQQQMEAISSGAEMYITKPFSTEFLRISVMQVMERKERLKSYFSSPISSFEKTEGKLMHRDSKKFLQSVLKIINDNITNSELTTKFIAEKLAMSSRSLYRKMEETGNGSPATLIKFCRLHVAKDLLLTTHKTVDEIVFDSGFSNKVSFFKAFREMYGCTPKDFRKRQLKEINEDNKNNNNE